MPLFIVLIIAVLIALSIIALMAVGLCLGMAYLMAYFVPALDLTSTLLPAAILATTIILMLASVFKLWIAETIKNTYPSLYGYDDDEEDEDDEDDEDDEPEPPVTKVRSYPVKKTRH